MPFKTAGGVHSIIQAEAASRLGLIQALGLIVMVFIQFTVSGPSFPVGEFTARHSLGVASSWQKGDVRRFGKVHEDSGFGLSLPDAENPVAAIPLIEAFMEDHAQWLSELPRHGASASLHVGMTVGEQRSFVPTIELSPELLHRLAANGITLSVTGYPTCDETQPSVPLDVPAAASRHQGRE